MIVFFTVQVDKVAVGDMVGGSGVCLCKAGREKKQEGKVA